MGGNEGVGGLGAEPRGSTYQSFEIEREKFQSFIQPDIEVELKSFQKNFWEAPKRAPNDQEGIHLNTKLIAKVGAYIGGLIGYPAALAGSVGTAVSGLATGTVFGVTLYSTAAHIGVSAALATTGAVLWKVTVAVAGILIIGVAALAIGALCLKASGRYEGIKGEDGNDLTSWQQFKFCFLDLCRGVHKINSIEKAFKNDNPIRFQAAVDVEALKAHQGEIQLNNRKFESPVEVAAYYGAKNVEGYLVKQGFHAILNDERAQCLAYGIQDGVYKPKGAEEFVELCKSVGITCTIPDYIDNYGDRAKHQPGYEVDELQLAKLFDNLNNRKKEFTEAQKCFVEACQNAFFDPDDQQRLVAKYESKSRLKNSSQ